MPTFRYHSDIVAQFPRIIGGVIFARGMAGGESSADLKALFVKEQQSVLTRIGNTPLSEIASLSAWRGAFRQFGVDPTQHRSAPEALLRRLTKKGDVPSINRLVDIGNLVSIRYALPVAVFDTRAVQGAVTVHFADGGERYTELGAQEVIHPETGEVIFSDETGMVVARRWCWRQSAESAATESTVDAIITVEAQHEGGGADVEHAVDDLASLMSEFAGGSYASAILDAASPVFAG